jgi:hypothetical protein
MEYTLYSVDDVGHVMSHRLLVARDDLAALEEAEKSCERHDIEVWEGTRRVARVKLGNAALNASDRMSL